MPCVPRFFLTERRWRTPWKLQTTPLLQQKETNGSIAIHHIIYSIGCCYHRTTSLERAVVSAVVAVGIVPAVVADGWWSSCCSGRRFYQPGLRPSCRYDTTASRKTPNHDVLPRESFPILCLRRNTRNPRLAPACRVTRSAICTVAPPYPVRPLPTYQGTGVDNYYPRIPTVHFLRRSVRRFTVYVVLTSCTSNSFNRWLLTVPRM